MFSQPLKEKHTPLRWEELEGLERPLLRRRLLERMASSAEGHARFWKKAEIGEPDDCWNWKGWINRYGYYVIRVYRQGDKGKNFNFEAHRIAYLLKNGNLPDDLLVCHECDNRICVNPKHLFIGTYQDNSTDMVQKRRQKVGESVTASKLTEKEVYEIRRLLSEGVPKNKIAPLYGINDSNLLFIERRITWKHLPEDPMNDPMFL